MECPPCAEYPDDPVKHGLDDRIKCGCGQFKILFGSDMMRVMSRCTGRRIVYPVFYWNKMDVAAEEIKKGAGCGALACG
jgi:hypothetical protein